MRRRWMLIGKLSRPWRRMTQARNRLAAAWRKVLKKWILKASGDRHGLEQPGHRNCVAAALANSMFHHGREYRLHMLRYERTAPANQGPGARGPQ